MPSSNYLKILIRVEQDISTVISPSSSMFPVACLQMIEVFPGSSKSNLCSKVVNLHSPTGILSPPKPVQDSPKALIIRLNRLWYPMPCCGNVLESVGSATSAFLVAQVHNEPGVWVGHTIIWTVTGVGWHFYWLQDICKVFEGLFNRCQSTYGIHPLLCRKGMTGFDVFATSWNSGNTSQYMLLLLPGWMYW